MGFCPSCVMATHIAIPGSYHVGPFDELKLAGLRIWSEEGPAARRRLAAIDYVLNSERMRLPVGWDWAARSSEFHAPDPPPH